MQAVAVPDAIGGAQVRPERRWPLARVGTRSNRSEEWFGARWPSRTGERLFGETSGEKPARLVESRTVGEGLIYVIYEVG